MNKPFLQRLFSWESYENGDEYIQFDNCTLQTEIGNHQPGTKFEAISFHFFTGELTLWNNNMPERHQIHAAIDSEIMLLS